MIAIVRCYKHNVKPLKELAAILSRKNKCEYKVLIDLSCVAVINDSKIETNE